MAFIPAGCRPKIIMNQQNFVSHIIFIIIIIIIIIIIRLGSCILLFVTMLWIITMIMILIITGQIHGRTRRRSPSPPPGGYWPKIEMPGRSKVGFISPRMHQNWPFKAQKSKRFLGGTQPHPSTQPLGAFVASILAPTALDSSRSRLRRLRCLGPRHLHSPP